MKKSNLFRTIAMLSVSVLTLMALVGCAGIEQNSEEAKAQAENRQFMSDVNAAMDDLSQQLDGFDEAVAQGDMVSMRTQADSAFKVLDGLDALEAPEVLADVKQGYVDGCNQMKDALNDYISLYAAMQSGSIDAASYESRLQAVQEAYDQAVEKLKATDEAATQL